MKFQEVKQKNQFAPLECALYGIEWINGVPYYIYSKPVDKLHVFYACEGDRVITLTGISDSNEELPNEWKFWEPSDGFI